ncbi:hypothetical protein IV203_024206 [Nitzschia inconspicua]|uniref:Uncharacterized protein n=1 Tax=Nitzschia inconspicua TaxID=303405 RepID=A0A9K3PAW6_9STRA|nr:hypothetical protein IV203_024206 [Nitzschia inconspicua]
MRPRRTPLTNGGRLGRRWRALGIGQSHDGIDPMSLIVELPVGGTYSLAFPRAARTNPYFRKVFVAFCVTLIAVLSLDKVYLQRHNKPDSENVADETDLSTFGTEKSRLLRHSRTADPTTTSGQSLSLPRPQVCSHQLLNAPTRHGDAPIDGSLPAMKAFWDIGVTCFDVDVITLQDGTLLATHPRRLASMLSRKLPVVVEESQVHQWNISMIRDTLGEEVVDVTFPLLDVQLLPQYAQLIEGSPAFFEPTDPQPHDNRYPTKLTAPLLNLDLKQGPYLTEERLMHIVHSIANLQLESNVAICVTELTEHEKLSALDMLDILHRHNLQVITGVSDSIKQKPIPLGLVLRDRAEEDQNVERIRQIVQNHKPHSIQLLVPSFRFESSWYQEIAATPVLSRLPMTVWTVDEPDEYSYALKMNVTAIIANRPTDYIDSEKDAPVENILE